MAGRRKLFHLDVEADDSWPSQGTSANEEMELVTGSVTCGMELAQESGRERSRYKQGLFCDQPTKGSSSAGRRSR